MIAGMTLGFKCTQTLTPTLVGGVVMCFKTRMIDVAPHGRFGCDAQTVDMNKSLQFNLLKLPNFQTDHGGQSSTKQTSKAVPAQISQRRRMSCKESDRFVLEKPTTHEQPQQKTHPFGIIWVWSSCLSRSVYLPRTHLNDLT